MGLTKQQLEALNQSSFPNNNAGAITPDILRQYNVATIANTVNQDTYTTDSASFSSRILAITGSTTNTGSLLTTASFNAYTQSTNLFTASISTSVGLLQTFSGSEYKADSSSFTSRINSFASASIPDGTISSSAQIAAFGYATTSSVTALSQSLYFTDTTQSVNITQASASAWGAFQSASAYSASGYQSDATQSFQITANALTASNATTALSQSLYFTDTTQSVNINSNSSSIGLLQTFSGSQYKNDSSSFNSRIITIEGKTLVSGSSQIDVMSTTNIARLATTGSNTFTGTQTLTGTTNLTDSTATGNGDKTVSIVGNKPGVGYHNINYNGYQHSFYVGGSQTLALTMGTTGNVTPGANGTQDLGSSALRWSTIYTSDLSLNNGIGDWTIVEGEDDLFLYNNKKCKVYKFALTEVDPNVATPKKS
jgi:hypothetical protein